MARLGAARHEQRVAAGPALTSIDQLPVRLNTCSTRSAPRCRRRGAAAAARTERRAAHLLDRVVELRATRRSPVRSVATTSSGTSTMASPRWASSSTDATSAHCRSSITCSRGPPAPLVLPVVTQLVSRSNRGAPTAGSAAARDRRFEGDQGPPRPERRRALIGDAGSPRDGEPSRTRCARARATVVLPIPASPVSSNDRTAPSRPRRRRRRARR